MIKCNCGKLAVWLYMPTGEGDRYYCEDCVPRGCYCNHEYVDTMEAYGIDEGKNLPDEKVSNWKWIEEGKIWCRLDGSNRELPCCEFFYDDLGFEDEE